MSKRPSRVGWACMCWPYRVGWACMCWSCRVGRAWVVLVEFRRVCVDLVELDEQINRGGRISNLDEHDGVYRLTNNSWHVDHLWFWVEFELSSFDNCLSYRDELRYLDHFDKMIKVLTLLLVLQKALNTLVIFQLIGHT